MSSTNRIRSVGEIADIIEDKGVEWAVIEFYDRTPDVLSVSTTVLHAAGVDPIKRWSPIEMYVDADAENEFELNPTGFHLLTPEEVARFQNNRRV